MNYYSSYGTAIASNLAETQFQRHDQSKLNVDDGLGEWLSLARSIYEQSSTLYFIGNGASATMSSHMALDFTKNGGINALAFNDSAFLTAISNDISYQSVFSLCIEKFGKTGDLLVAISSSGNSENIINGVIAAKSKGMKTITLSGMKADNPLRQLGDLNVYVPAETYGIVECCHQVLLHCWLDRHMEIEPK